MAPECPHGHIAYCEECRVESEVQERLKQEKRTETKRPKNQQAAYEAGRADERKRWAKNLRRFLTTVPEDSQGIVMGLVFTDAILERIRELAKAPKKTK